MAKLSELLDFRKPRRTPLQNYIQKLRDRGLNDRGQQIPDPVPMAPPIGYKKQPTMVEIIRQQIASHHLAEEARARGMDTLEEADDFDVGDDADELVSGYENDLDPPIRDLAAAGKQAQTEREAAEAAKKSGVQGGEAPPAKGDPSSP